MRELLFLEAGAEKSKHRFVGLQFLDLLFQLDKLRETVDVGQHPLEGDGPHSFPHRFEIARGAEQLRQPVGRIAQGEQFGQPELRLVGVEA